MPYLIKNILYVAAKELTENGIVNEYTLKSGLDRQRKGIVNCWEHKRFSNTDGKWVEHPLDTRKGQVYVVYETMKPQYKEAVKRLLCDNTDPVTHTQNQQNRLREQKQSEFTSRIAEDLNVKTEYTEFFFQHDFAPEDAHRLARGAAWLDLFYNISWPQARKHGFESMNDFRNEVLRLIQVDIEQQRVRFRGLKMGSLAVLYRNAANFRQNGCKALLSERFGKKNAGKITDQVHAWLMNEMSKPTKPSYEDVAMRYNMEAVKQNPDWKRITVSAIRQHLDKTDNKRIWYFARHGVDAGNNEFQSLIQRRQVSFPDALVSVDGTALQLYYINSEGKIKSDLYIYHIVDTYSLAILGYSVAFTETAQMVTEALHNYVENCGYKPYQLQYDNSSANVSAAVKALMKNMAKVVFPCKPYRGRSKYVEAVIGHFEQRVLRQFENFKGGSPTTKDLNSKANPDLLKAIKHELPTEQQVLEMVKEAVELWNNRGERRNQFGEFEGETRMERYAHPHEKRVKLNYFEQLALCMVDLVNSKTKDGLYKYGKQGIEIRVNGQERNYIVPDPDGIGDFIFQNIHYGNSFRVRLNTKHPELIELWSNGKRIAEAYEKERYAACMADMEEGEYAKIRKYQDKQELFGVIQSQNELERQRRVLENVGYKATGTDGFSWSDMAKNDYNQKEGQEVDRMNGISESDLVQRLKRLGN